MKKIAFLIVIVSVLAACLSSSGDQPAAPEQTSEVSKTSEVLPATSTPIPTPTLHPEFIALQETIASSGERFTLQANGTIWDGENKVALPGVRVDRNGVMTITVNGEQITLDPSKVILDDENGFSYPGYEQNANGEWVEVELTAKFDNGVVITLGEADGDGIREVTEVRVDNDKLSEAQKELLVNQLNPEYVGFKPEEAKLYYDAENQNYWVGSADDPSNVIARQDVDTGRIIWDFDKMKDEYGESILFRIAHIWEMKGVMPVDLEAAKMDSGKLYDEIIKSALENGQFAWGRVRSMFYLYNSRRNIAIGGFLLTDFMPEPFEPKRVDIYGQISFFDEQGNLTQIMTENFDCDTRFWK
jgi:hypothetical protein